MCRHGRHEWKGGRMAVMGSLVVGVRTAMDVWLGMAVIVVGPVVRPPGPTGTGQDKANAG